MNDELTETNLWEKNIDIIADEIKKQKPHIILHEDIEAGIMEKCDSNKGIKYDRIPEPFAGNPEAPIYLLNLNPGTDPYEGIKDNEELMCIRERLNRHILWNLVLYSDGAGHQSLSHLNSELKKFKEYPFYPLDPDYKYLPGFAWWYDKLENVINGVKNDRTVGNNDVMKSIEIISRSIFNIDIFPYHSESYPNCANRKLFPSQKFGIYLVKKAIEDKKNKKIIVIMKGVDRWEGQVEGLEDYDLAFQVKNPRNSKISENNITSLKEGRGLDGRYILEEIINEIKKRANNNR